MCVACVCVWRVCVSVWCVFVSATVQASQSYSSESVCSDWKLTVSPLSLLFNTPVSVPSPSLSSNTSRHQLTSSHRAPRPIYITFYVQNRLKHHIPHANWSPVTHSIWPMQGNAWKQPSVSLMKQCWCGSSLEQILRACHVNVDV